MNRKKLTWNDYQKFLGRITHITSDWLTPVDYLPYIDALLGDIDLDPCSTYHANAQFLRAKKIYTLDDDGLNIQDPWTGVTYLFPPTYGRCSFNKERGTWRWSLKAGAAAKAPAVIWFQRLLKEWKLRNVPEALFYTTYTEIMRRHQSIFNFPICVPTKRAAPIDGKSLIEKGGAFTWGIFVYLPGTELGIDYVHNFERIFSHLGRVIA
ncbi:MAG: hypothetical protein EBU08_08215 [Micrococcales bacterium]|nr:hypothetical protein [Micrococcales bacterium]